MLPRARFGRPVGTRHFAAHPVRSPRAHRMPDFNSGWYQRARRCAHLSTRTPSPEAEPARLSKLKNTCAGGRRHKFRCRILHKRLLYVPRNENLVLVTTLPFNRLEYQRRSPWPVRVGAPQNQTSPRAFPQTSLPRHLFFRRELICHTSFYVGTNCPLVGTEWLFSLAAFRVTKIDV